MGGGWAVVSLPQGTPAVGGEGGGERRRAGESQYFHAATHLLEQRRHKKVGNGGPRSTENFMYEKR
jgi:hypothetical protein